MTAGAWISSILIYIIGVLLTARVYSWLHPETKWGRALSLIPIWLSWPGLIATIVGAIIYAIFDIMRDWVQRG